MAVAATEAGYDLPFGFAKAAVQYKGTTHSCTFTDAGDLVGFTAHGLAVDDRVVFITKVSTTGITLLTYYYVKTVPSADTFTIAATSGGSTVALTTDGTGTFAKLFEYRLRIANNITGNADEKTTNYEGDDIIIKLINTQSVGFKFGADALPIAVHAAIFGLSEVTSGLPDSYTSAYGWYTSGERTGATVGFWGEGSDSSVDSSGVISSKTLRYWYPNMLLTIGKPPDKKTSDKPSAFEYNLTTINMQPTVDVMGVALPVTSAPVIVMRK
jgi:hypothetical protein